MFSRSQSLDVGGFPIAVFDEGLSLLVEVDQLVTVEVEVICLRRGLGGGLVGGERGRETAELGFARRLLQFLESVKDPLLVGFGERVLGTKLRAWKQDR